MAHVYKVSEWQGGSGCWRCSDTSDLGHGSGRWWIPARVLGISPAAYVELLVKDYQVDHISFNNNMLVFSWDEKNYARMHKYVLWINKIARNKNFII